MLLLVEDSEDDAFFFSRTLQRTGMACGVHHVTDGAQAVAYLQDQAASESKELPGMIFLDLKTPILNGFEVLEWLRKQPFAADIQVIVLSGSEHEDDKKRAAQLGASQYVVKPIQIQDLQRYLHDLCPPEIGATS